MHFNPIDAYCKKLVIVLLNDTWYSIDESAYILLKSCSKAELATYLTDPDPGIRYIAQQTFRELHR